MRFTIFITLLCLNHIAWSQLSIKPIERKVDKTVNQIQKPPASLPFWDDFSISEISVDSIRIWGTDTTAQWDVENSKDVYVNATLAINPPTYKVVTFDGLNEDGGFRNDTLGIADQLQSSIIDLSGYQLSDSVYMSFYWQSTGNVERPDERDSIRLQFYNPTNGWRTFWSAKGSEDKEESDSVFTYTMRLLEEDYLTNEFKFRFQSFGDLTGPFDVWHLDWVYINSGRTKNEKRIGFNDGAITGQLLSPFTPFTVIPTNHFNSNKYLKNQSVSISYLGKDRIYQITMNHIIQILNNDEIIISDSRALEPLGLQETFRPIILGIGDPNVQDVYLKDQDFSSLQMFDSALIQSTVFIRNDNDDFMLSDKVDLRINDTIRQQYLMHDYFAYDDGSAEYAAGTNIANGQVAVKFWLEEEDTLTHVAFHFPNIAPSPENKSLTLNIYKTLDNDISPIRSQQINIKTDSVINGFSYYELIRPLILTDTFFVAYQQNSSEYIGIGFDRSNSIASDYIFENGGEEWEKNTTLSGALMIRPVFRNVQDFTLSKESAEVLSIYPNPSDGALTINGHYKSIEILNISGQVLMSEKAKLQHNISTLASGLYLLKIHQKDGIRTYKIIRK